MRIDGELAQVSPDRDSVVTVGVFDGVHLGHQHLISSSVEEACRSDRVSIVATFRNHPRSVLTPGFTPRYITGPEERVRLIAEAGADLVVPVTFDREMSELSARDFLDLLMRRLRMRALVVGPDFALGREREGDVDKLRSLSLKMGFSLSVVDLLENGGQPIRSTTVRQAVADGAMPLVRSLLGRPFTLDGRIGRGAGRGREMGFPTANLEVAPDRAMPADGIYAAWALFGGRRCMAATSIGTRPTFEETDRTVEAFLLDFHGDLYGHDLRLEPVRRLRDEIRYESVDALKEQIAKDIEETKAALTADIHSARYDIAR